MNYLLIIVVLILAWRMIDGFRQGMVKEIQAFIALIVSSVSIVLICRAVNAYMNEETIGIVISILLLVIVALAFKILQMVLFPAKTIAKLPVINIVDKILGIAMGAVEVVCLLWALYIVADTFLTGEIARMANHYIDDSQILTYLHDNNLLVTAFHQLTETIAEMI